MKKRILKLFLAVQEVADEDVEKYGTVEYKEGSNEIKRIKGTIIWKEFYSIEKRSKEIEKELKDLLLEKEEKEKILK